MPRMNAQRSERPSRRLVQSFWRLAPSVARAASHARISYDWTSSSPIFASSIFMEGNMARCIATFLFDQGQLFQESWELTEDHPDSLHARLKRIAQARLP